MAVLAAKYVASANSLDSGLDKDKKKIRIFITLRCAKRRRYPLYLNPFWYTCSYAKFQLPETAGYLLKNLMNTKKIVLLTIPGITEGVYFEKVERY